MTRIKFVVFALAAIGLWAAHLFLLSPFVSVRAVEQASLAAAAAPSAAALRVQEQRIAVQKTALKLIGNDALFNALKPSGKVEAPTPEKFAAVRAAVNDALPESLKADAIIGVANDAGALWSKGDSAPSTATGDVDIAKVAGAGGDGMSQDAFGAPHIFYSVPVVVPQPGAEAKVLGTIVVGAPLLPPGVAASVAKDLKLDGVALVGASGVVDSAGAEKAEAEKAAQSLKPGAADVVSRGGVAALGPMQLPAFTQGDGAMGGGAPLSVGVRQPLGVGPWDVVVIASVKPTMQSLAEYQRFAVLSLLGLVALALVWTALMGAGKAAAAAEAAPEEQKQESPPAMQVTTSQFTSAQPNQVVNAEQGGGEAPALGSLAEEQKPPEASPDDFPFGNPPPAEESKPPEPPRERQPIQTDPEADPFANLGAPPSSRTKPPRTPAFDNEDNVKTTAYSVAAPDPFAMASEQGGDSSAPPPPEGDYNPDSTRVAAIPQELLAASARPMSTNPGMGVAGPRQPLPKMPAAAPVAIANPEEAHFQEVYRDFVTTREKCGEAADGLTYDKFVLKLRKNRDQLMQKYNCRSVRFQVYVKEGKAALKATPVRE